MKPTLQFVRMITYNLYVPAPLNIPLKSLTHELVIAILVLQRRDQELVNSVRMKNITSSCKEQCQSDYSLTRQKSKTCNTFRPAIYSLLHQSLPYEC